MKRVYAAEFLLCDEQEAPLLQQYTIQLFQVLTRSLCHPDILMDLLDAENIAVLSQVALDLQAHARTAIDAGKACKRRGERRE